MTQRLGLARVLLHEPQVLLLDEPASGLDPRARIEMYELLKELRNMGKTILVSSHILPELAKVCNKIGIIERGKLLFDGDVESAKRQILQRTVLKVSVGDGRNLEAKQQLESHSSVDKIEHKADDDLLLITLREGMLDGSFIAETLVQKGFRLKMLREEEVNLEDVFMGITKGITN
jgi:ABC-2 type transport system ATP-binding protein